jgi:hypothetical protein
MSNGAYKDVVNLTLSCDASSNTAEPSVLKVNAFSNSCSTSLAKSATVGYSLRLRRFCGGVSCSWAVEQGDNLEPTKMSSKQIGRAMVL